MLGRTKSAAIKRCTKGGRMILAAINRATDPGIVIDARLLHAGEASNSFLFVPCTPRPFLFFSYLTAWKRKTCIVARSDDPWWAISVSVLVNKASFSPETPEHRYRGSDSAHHALQACRKSSCYYQQVVTRGKKKKRMKDVLVTRVSLLYSLYFYVFAQRYYFL